MRTYDCPSCGATVTFQSSVSVFAVCSFCRSMVLRRDLDLENLGTMAELPPDLSPLQLGAEGEFAGLPFRLVGRLRLKWAQGSWNEWCAAFPENRYGWVAEAQGFFMVSFEYQAPADLPALTDLAPGQRLKLGDQQYTIADIKQRVCLAGEGELPFAAPPGRTGTSIDLTGPGKAFACLEFYAQGTRLYVGQYARFDDLKFTALRAVPGWSPGAEADPTRGATTAFACPNCAAPVTLRAAGLSMTAVCDSCGSLIDTSDANYQLLARAERKTTVKPVLPLGTRGLLFGAEFEVVGFLRRTDQYASWFEYLLFNPYQGFRWLVTYHGHWSFITTLLEHPQDGDRGPAGCARRAEYQARRYRLFADGAARVTYVLGEFYWRVAIGEQTHLTDYVSPPRILSREAYPGLKEVTWSEGEYVEPAVIQEAFKPPKPLPDPGGIYLNQPNPHAERWRGVRWWALAFVGLLGLIEFLSWGRSASQVVYDHDFVYRASETNRTVVTEPFELKGGPQAVQFISRAQVNNNWLELDLDLVSAATERTVSLEQGLEYYSGWDDGPWSEGNPVSQRVLPAVAPGKYYLAITPSADPQVAEMPYHVRVVRDVTLWSNFWLGLIAVLVYPLYLGIRSSAFERSRWSESDYSPYGSSSSEDDESS